MELNMLYGVLGAIATVIGFLISIATFSRNRDKDVVANATQQAVINTKLDIAIGGIERVNSDMKAHQKELDTVRERVIVNESLIRSAHKRIDRLEENENEK